MNTPTTRTTNCNNIKFQCAGYCLLAICIGLYAVIIHLVLNFQIRIDFSPFYASSQALQHGHNPYVNLTAYFLPGTPLLPANLNPPLFLLLFSPLSHLNYETALSIWMVISLIMGLLGILIVIKLAFPRPFIRQYWAYLLSFNLLFYATVANTGIAQVGTPLLFFIMAGYLCYRHKHDTLAGVLWGFIIAIKFFPALLFFLVLSEKRYRVFGVMFLTVLVLSIVPWIVYGAALNQYYFSMLQRVLWYGDSWNASLYGFIIRCWVDPHSWADFHISPPNLPLVKTVYLALFGLALMAYWYLLKIKSENTHQTFCLTLTVMLLLSPLGWLYYCPLLLLPLAITWQAYSQELPKQSSYFLMYLVSFFLINLPIDYMQAWEMSSWFDKAVFYSLLFYGLLLLSYLCINIPTIDQHIKPSQQEIRQAGFPVLIIILTGASWPTLHAALLYLQSLIRIAAN